MSTTIVCPSGLSLAIRGMRGKELKILSDAKALKSGLFLDQLYDACVESVLDPGPYQVGDDGKLNWDSVLVGDRMFVMIRIRAETFGEEFAFNYRCRSCEKREEYTFDLSALESKPLAPEDAAAVRSGSGLKAKYPGTGADVLFRLGTGSDEKWIAKNATGKDQAVLEMVVRRIISIEGVEQIKSFLEETSLGDLMKLLKEMNKRDCGVDTDVLLPCPNCSAVNKVTIPIGSVPFLAPQ